MSSYVDGEDMWFLPDGRRIRSSLRLAAFAFATFQTFALLPGEDAVSSAVSLLVILGVYSLLLYALSSPLPRKLVDRLAD